MFIFDGLPIGFMFIICYYYKPSNQQKTSRLKYKGCTYKVLGCERCGVVNSPLECARFG
jgi:hypothetical protein